MLLLALDSAEATCSVALWDLERSPRDALLAYRDLPAGRGHADRLIGLIEAALEDAGVAYAALGVLAVNHGPGSFTGVRSAVAAGRGLALSAGLPVLPVSSLEALAAVGSEPRSGLLLAAMDARRGEVYAQAFTAELAPLAAPRVGPPGVVAAGLPAGPLRLLGSGAQLIATCLPVEVDVTIEPARLDARAVARCAARRLAAGAPTTAGSALRPLYLRPPDARPQVSLLAAVGGD